MLLLVIRSTAAHPLTSLTTRYPKSMAQTIPHHPPTHPAAPSAAALIDAEVAHGTRTLTPLGRTLLEARRAIEQAGELAADEQELERDKAERRGGMAGRF